MQQIEEGTFRDVYAVVVERSGHTETQHIPAGSARDAKNIFNAVRLFPFVS